jgi:hypothetical protein
MPKYSSENERVKRDYAFFLETASGKQDATIDAALRAIDRFETSSSRKPFSKFHIEQARSFRAGLLDQTGPNGRPLSAATITTTLSRHRLAPSGITQSWSPPPSDSFASALPGSTSGFHDR